MEIEGTILSEIELAQQAQQTVNLKLELFEGEKTVSVDKQLPQNVAGLDQAAFEALACLYYPPRFIGRDVYLYDFLMKLCGFDKLVWDNLDAETVKDLLVLINPFLTEKPISFKNLAPKIEIEVATKTKFKTKRYTLIGRDNGLTGLVFDEYIFMELNFDKYLETKDEKYLTALASVFFREKGVSFKDYLEMEEQWFDFASNHFNRHQKAAALFAYQCMRNYLSNKFTRVFRQGGQGGENSGWRKTVVRLAGEKFGKPDEVRFTLLYDVMEELEDRLANKKKS